MARRIDAPRRHAATAPSPPSNAITMPSHSAPQGRNTTCRATRTPRFSVQVSTIGSTSAASAAVPRKACQYADEPPDSITVGTAHASPAAAKSSEGRRSTRRPGRVIA